MSERRAQRLLLAGTLVLVVLVICLGPSLGQESESPSNPAAQEETAADPGYPDHVGVFFVTNRQRLSGTESDAVFGGERGETSFGTCEVEFKPIPTMESIARKVPFWIPTESSDQRILLQDRASDFWERLTTAAKATRTGDVVVFIHGYSYDFERVCDRGAETQRALDGEAVLLLFTWPSDGNPTEYASDQTDLEWSVPFLVSVLRQLEARVGAEHLQVLAHSLGSRAIIEALLEIRAEGRTDPLLEQVVFLAPDFDSGTFVELLPDLEAVGGEITLYASANDTPLKVSQRLNGSPRLGQAGEFLTLVEGVETIDVTPAGRYRVLGHEYFYFHPLVAADLVELVTTGRRAAARSAPRLRERDGLPYWEIVEEERQ